MSDGEREQLRRMIVSISRAMLGDAAVSHLHAMTLRLSDDDLLALAKLIRAFEERTHNDSNRRKP